MNRYKTSAELKNLAKEKLEGHYGPAIIAFLTIVCVEYFANMFTSMIPDTGILSIAFTFLLTGVISIFAGILNTGISLFFLNLACGQPFKTSDVFYGYTHQAEKSIKISLVNVLLSMICLSIPQLLCLLYMEKQTMSYFYLAMVALIVGTIIYVQVSLMISQSYYLLLDFPNYSAKQVLQTSCKIMKGHKKRLFYIQLSFIPLMLLGFLTCGIGLLWIMPYMQMTSTYFFLDIMNPEKKM